MPKRMHVKIHPSADVSPQAKIGANTSIWNNAQVRSGASIGENCVLSKDVYIDAGVVIGDNVKIQNGVSVYHGVTIEDGVFCGPHCVFTNDKAPRAINPDGSLKGASDWEVSSTLLQRGASIGANATIVCGITVGEWALVGAGAVATKDVPAHGIVVGCPARLIGYACRCGAKLPAKSSARKALCCSKCGAETKIKSVKPKRKRR